MIEQRIFHLDQIVLQVPSRSGCLVDVSGLHRSDEQAQVGCPGRAVCQELVVCRPWIVLLTMHDGD